MDAIAAPDLLHTAIDRHCVRIARPRYAVLFHRGDTAFGVFLVLTGSVMLDFGTSGSRTLTSPCGPGALIGLPATLSKTAYTMTATVVRDTTLGFLSTKRFLALLQDYPHLSLEVLKVLSAKIEILQHAQKPALPVVM